MFKKFVVALIVGFTVFIIGCQSTDPKAACDFTKSLGYHSCQITSRDYILGRCAGRSFGGYSIATENNKLVVCCDMIIGCQLGSH